jgi:hypothetical protein
MHDARNADNNSERRRVSRRVMLAGTTFALSAAAAAATASKAVAQQKISQTEAKYQGSPKGDRRCDGCVNFQAPNACKFVDGEISPSGWCQLFYPKS